MTDTAAWCRCSVATMLFGLGTAVLCLPGGARAAGRCPEWAARIVSVQGRVEAQLAGETAWHPVRINDTFCPRDQVRTLEKSRAAIRLRSETVMRLDQNTLVRFSAATSRTPTLLELIRGSAFFMSRFRRPLTIETPYVNATSGGTEYHIEVNEKDHTATVTVIEGKMNVGNKAGSVTVEGGQAAVIREGRRPVLRLRVRVRDVVQWAVYYPPVLSMRDLGLGGAGQRVPAGGWRERVRRSAAAYREGRIEEAFAALKGAPSDITDARFYVYRASLLLSVGRVHEAKADLTKAYDLAPRGGLPLALQAIIAVAQSQPARALKLASNAAEVQPEAVSVQMALSYAEQANFDLPAALAAARKAVKIDADASLAWARLAELRMARGNLDKALTAAKRAEALNPREVRAQTVLGFAYLTRINIPRAKDAFAAAITLNPADPLPRLGLGLARIREGHLALGRKQIEIAAALDPLSSLIRSYLGKAYYEEKRDKRAAAQFRLAEKLDPKDPTPHLYDAIRKQTVNRPVGALHDLQESIKLNDNRAVYRSRFLLDRDLATRSVSQGRVYDDLGFGQLALVEGWKSVSVGPASYSAHRFLADTYAALPDSNIARLSSLLTSQLLQPLNNNPIQPSLGDSAAGTLLVGVRPVNPSFNEYSQLFLSNRNQLLASGIAGGNDTLGDDVIASGLHGRYSYSLGQSYYKTAGYRTNADLSNTNYDAFAQMVLTPDASVQAEYRYSLTNSGDVALRFDPGDFLKTERQKTERNTARLGFRYRYTPYSQTIVSAFYQNIRNNVDIPELFNTSARSMDKVYGGEVQQLHHVDRFDFIVGAGHFEGDSMTRLSNDFAPSAKPVDTDSHFTSLYLYSLIHLPHDATLTIGESVNLFKGQRRDRNQYNPKMGLLWNITPSTTLRVAYFRVLARPFVSDQTIEPTQVAGFQQFFDDTDGTDAIRYGAGINQKFSSNLFGGIEVSKRKQKVPYSVTSGATGAVSSHVLQSEDRLGSAYLAWTPYRWAAVRADYFYQRYHQDNPTVSLSDAPRMTTHRVPLGLNFYHPCGLFAKFTQTYIDQRVTVLDPVSRSLNDEGSKFWITDMEVGYRLPRRMGIVSVKVNNLFDRNFRYQGVTGAYPSILPERVVYTRLTLLF